MVWGLDDQRTIEFRWYESGEHRLTRILVSYRTKLPVASCTTYAEFTVQYDVHLFHVLVYYYYVSCISLEFIRLIFCFILFSENLFHYSEYAICSSFIKLNEQEKPTHHFATILRISTNPILFPTLICRLSTESDSFWQKNS